MEKCWLQQHLAGHWGGKMAETGLEHLRFRCAMEQRHLGSLCPQMLEGSGLGEGRGGSGVAQSRVTWLILYPFATGVGPGEQPNLFQKEGHSACEKPYCLVSSCGSQSRSAAFPRSVGRRLCLLAPVKNPLYSAHLTQGRIWLSQGKLLNFPISCCASSSNLIWGGTVLHLFFESSRGRNCPWWQQI